MMMMMTTMTIMVMKTRITSIVNDVMCILLRVLLPLLLQACYHRSESPAASIRALVCTEASEVTSGLEERSPLQPGIPSRNILDLDCKKCEALKFHSVSRACSIYTGMRS